MSVVASVRPSSGGPVPGSRTASSRREMDRQAIRSYASPHGRPEFSGDELLRDRDGRARTCRANVRRPRHRLPLRQLRTHRLARSSIKPLVGRRPSAQLPRTWGNKRFSVPGLRPARLSPSSTSPPNTSSCLRIGDVAHRPLHGAVARSSCGARRGRRSSPLPSRRSRFAATAAVARIRPAARRGTPTAPCCW
jgi:hypothetical protein